MVTRRYDDLLLLNIVAILLITVISLFPSGIMRIVLGLPFLVLFPGYTLVAALFPRKDTLGRMGRLGLSLGTSIVVVSSLGLGLNYTPWGIGLYPVVFCVAIFVFAGSGVTWYRRRLLPETDVFVFSLRLRLSFWQREGTLDRALSVALIAAILGTVGILGYILATPRIGETYTEFYILGEEGLASNYPKEGVVAREQTIIIGIVNREQKRVSYRIQVIIDGEIVRKVEPVPLDYMEKWEQIVSFTPRHVGDNQKIEFLLYRDEDNTPYQQPLHLWINVRAEG